MNLTTLISAADKDHYDTNGYCIIDDVYSAEELQEIEDFFENFKEREDKTFENGHVRLDEVDRTKQQVRVLQPHRIDERVMNWFLHPNVAQVLETLLEKPAYGAQTMFYYKPPGSKGQGMHQDNFYLLAAPATCIGAWTPLDDAEVENGCLWVVPGSNRDAILCPQGTQDRWLDYGDSHISQFPRETKPVAVPVMRGQTIFFSGNLIHGSGPNRTKDRWRRTFIGHYCDAATESLSRFYHPVLNMKGETVSQVSVHEGGGPCGDGWQGAQH